MDEINKEYQEICVVLGDVEVKLKGLNNQKEAIFAKLEELDRKAAALMQSKETDSEDQGA